MTKEEELTNAAFPGTFPKDGEKPSDLMQLLNAIKEYNKKHETVCELMLIICTDGSGMVTDTLDWDESQFMFDDLKELKNKLSI